MAVLLGKKVGMTQVYDQSGKLLPVTVIQAGPCPVLQVKSIKTDGYNAVQMGFSDVKKSRSNKPASGHAKKANTTAKRFIREMRLPEGEQPQYKLGDAITVSVFSENGFVDVAGISKGKGFQGVMKRYKFAGMPNSHGTERKHRSPGSIAGYGTDRGHGGDIKKGKRMAGHMGHCRITSKNHKVVSVDTENNLLVLKGSVPGPQGGFVVVKSARMG
jgi:large subunit ribosomal protein L3